MEKESQHSFVICYHDDCEEFSANTIDEIVEAITESKEKGVPPVSKLGRLYPETFVKRIKERYLGKLKLKDTEKEPPSPSPVIDFEKKNTGVTTDYIPDVEDVGQNFDEEIDEEFDLEITGTDDSSTSESESDEEDFALPEYAKVIDIGPITMGDLNKYVTQEDITVLFFHAEWDLYCKKLEKPWENFKNEGIPNTIFVKVNSDYSEEITSTYDVVGVPVFLLLKRSSDGKNIEKLDLLSGSEIKNLRNILFENLDKLISKSEKSEL